MIEGITNTLKSSSRYKLDSKLGGGVEEASRPILDGKDCTPTSIGVFVTKPLTCSQQAAA